MPIKIFVWDFIESFDDNELYACRNEKISHHFRFNFHSDLRDSTAVAYSGYVFASLFHILIEVCIFVIDKMQLFTSEIMKRCILTFLSILT